MKSMKRLLLATAGLFTLGLASCNFPYSPVDPQLNVLKQLI